MNNAQRLLKRDKIRQRQLPTAVVVKDYVDGHKVNYEQYLTELINASALRESNHNEDYRLIEHGQQSHGENDLEGDYYSLDFKLLTDPNYMEAKSTLSPIYFSPIEGDRL